MSRQTLYKRFGSRGELAQAYVLREAGQLVARVESAVTSNVEDPRRALSAAFDVFLSAAADNPLVRAITTDPGADELLELVTTRGGPVVAAATDRLSAVMQTSWPQLAARDADLMSEVVVRLAISTAALPDGRAGLTGASLAEVLGPFVDHALGRAPHERNAASATARSHVRWVHGSRSGVGWRSAPLTGIIHRARVASGPSQNATKRSRGPSRLRHVAAGSVGRHRYGRRCGSPDITARQMTRRHTGSDACRQRHDAVADPLAGVVVRDLAIPRERDRATPARRRPCPAITPASGKREQPARPATAERNANNGSRPPEAASRSESQRARHRREPSA